MTQPYEIRAYERTTKGPNAPYERIVFSLYVRDLPEHPAPVYVAATARMIQRGFDQGTRQSDRFTRVVVCNDDGSTYEP